MKKPNSSFVSIILMSICLLSCLDNNIEGALSSAPTSAFKVSKAVMSYTSLNNCNTYAPQPNGTAFYATIDYQGTTGDPIYTIDYTCSASNNTFVSSKTLYSFGDFTDTNFLGGSSSGFRSTSTSSANSFTIKTNDLSYYLKAIRLSQSIIKSGLLERMR